MCADTIWYALAPLCAKRKLASGKRRARHSALRLRVSLIHSFSKLPKQTTARNKVISLIPLRGLLSLVCLQTRMQPSYWKLSETCRLEPSIWNEQCSFPRKAGERVFRRYSWMILLNDHLGVPDQDFGMVKLEAAPEAPFT